MSDSSTAEIDQGNGGNTEVLDTTTDVIQSTPSVDTDGTSQDVELKGEAEGDKPEGVKTPKSAFAAAKAALAPKDTASPAGDAPKTAKDEKAATEGTKDPDADLPFGKHPRWKEVLAERDGYKSDADNWRRFNELVGNSGFESQEAVSGWLDSGSALNRVGVTPDERGLLLEFATAAKTDPERAYAIIGPIYESLRSVIGDVLPADLQTAVDNGEMTEEHAKRVARSEAASRINGQRVKQTTEQVQRDRDAEQVTQQARASATAVVAWERRVAATDPDWKRISGAVVEQVTLLRAARQPRTADESVKVCQEALEFVKRTMGYGGNPRPNVTPPNTHGSNNQGTPRPKSAFEAAKQALGR